MTQDVFTALADPTRRALLEELSVGERAVGELVAAVEASQPTVSKHLRVLRESGLVHQRAVGQKRFYRIEADVLLETAEALRELAGAPDSEPARRASSSETVEKAEAVEPARSTEPARILGAEPVEAHEDRPTASPAQPVGLPQQSPAAQQGPVPDEPVDSVEPVDAEEETAVGEAAPAEGTAAQPPAEPAVEPAAEPAAEPEEPAREAAPPRLDPLSAVQDGQPPARGRGVGGLVSSVLRRRRR